MATNSGTSDEASHLKSTLGWLAVVLALALPLYRPWVTLATSAILVLWLFGGGLRRYAGSLRRHRLTWAVLFFIALNISSLLWTDNFGGGLRYLTKYRYFLLVPMVATSVGPIFRRWAVTIFELSAGVSVLLSIGVFAGLFRLRDAHPGNPSPTMAHLDYGLLLALASLLVLVRVFHSEMSAVRRALTSGLALLLIVGLVINIGRAGHLAFVGGLAVLVVHWARGRSATAVAGVSVAAAAVLLLAWCSSPVLRARADDAQEQISAALVDHRYEGNLGGRIAALAVAREVFREHPILGTGVGGNVPAFRNIIDSRLEELKPSIYWYRHLHNQYTQVATELGAVGLLAMAWIFWELIRTPRRRRETDAAALILTAVYLLGFLGEPFLHKQITLVTFALFAGFIAAEELESNTTKVESSESRVRG